MVVVAVLGPVMLAYILIAVDMRSDLSGIRARLAGMTDGSTIVGWGDLEHDPDRFRMAAGRSRMLGYMMDGYAPVPDGRFVDSFVLMPEAGQLLHPAHRVPDEMVEVRLAPGHSVPYADRSLIWATGSLQRVTGIGPAGAAAWMLSDASVQRAEPRDALRWFGR